MKISLFYTAIVLTLLSCHFQNPQPKEVEGIVGTAYGKPFDYSQSLPAAELINRIENSSADTTVNGLINGICDSKKCVTVKATDQTQFTIRWINDFSADDKLNGKNIIAKGHAYKDTTKQNQYILDASGFVIY